MPRIAAVTMVYDEPDFLPIWVRYYSEQLGAAHCYVVDHGSDDGSTESLGAVNVLRLPRSARDEDKTCRFMSGFASSLLNWYDWVLHADADEIVVADPVLHGSLADYAAACEHDAVTTVGMNVVQAEGEAAIDPAAPILRQRGWAHFAASMCKPALTRRPIRWNAGFHRADLPPRFDDLFLFHLRWFDRAIGLRRLARSRAQEWADPAQAWWQRVPDERGAAMLAAVGARDRDATVQLRGDAPAVLAALRRSFGPDAGEDEAEVVHELNYQVTELWPIPARFAGIF